MRKFRLTTRKVFLTYVTFERDVERPPLFKPIREVSKHHITSRRKKNVFNVTKRLRDVVPVSDEKMVTQNTFILVRLLTSFGSCSLADLVGTSYISPIIHPRFLIVIPSFITHVNLYLLLPIYRHQRRRN